MPSCLDGKGDIWSGMLHRTGIFPVLGRTASGFVRTVIAERDARRIRYRVVYIKEDQLTADYHETFVYQKTGRYKVQSEAPQLCPNPTELVIAFVLASER